MEIEPSKMDGDILIDDRTLTSKCANKIGIETFREILILLSNWFKIGIELSINPYYYDYYDIFLVNHNNSLIWNKAIWG